MDIDKSSAVQTTKQEQTIQISTIYWALEISHCIVK